MPTSRSDVHRLKFKDRTEVAALEVPTKSGQAVHK